jgi:hypothetical protein
MRQAERATQTERHRCGFLGERWPRVLRNVESVDLRVSSFRRGVSRCFGRGRMSRVSAGPKGSWCGAVSIRFAVRVYDGCFCLFDPSRHNIVAAAHRQRQDECQPPDSPSSPPSLPFLAVPLVLLRRFARPWSSPRPQVRPSRFFCRFFLHAEPLTCSHRDATPYAHHRQYFSTLFSSVLVELRRTPLSLYTLSLTITLSLALICTGSDGRLIGTSSHIYM